MEFSVSRPGRLISGEEPLVNHWDLRAGMDTVKKKTSCTCQESNPGLRGPCPSVSIYGFTVFVDLGRFFSFLISTQSVELVFGRGFSPSQGRYLHTE
jgi:hypothetical protein